MKLTVSDFIGKLTMIVILIAMVIAIAYHPRTAEAADTGSLIIQNSLISDLPSDSDREFRIWIQQNSGSEALHGTYGQLTFTDGSAFVYLRNGDSVTATGLPDGLQLSVAELDIDQYLVPEGGDGFNVVIDKDNPQTVSFNHIRRPSLLNISKKVVGGSDADKSIQFSFTLQLNESINGEVINQGTSSEWHMGADFTNGKVEFSLSDSDEFSVLLPQGVGYTITESEYPDFELISKTNDNGTIGLAQIDALFTNTRQSETGHLSVKNTVVSHTEWDKTDKQFDYTVSLYDDNTHTSPASLPDGTYGDVTFTDAVATFRLKHNETAAISGLPTGLYYTVEQATANYYTTTMDSGNTGQISATASTAAFTNTRHEGTLKIIFDLTSNLPSDETKEFQIKVQRAHGNTVNETYGDLVFIDTIATVTMKKGDTITATGLPAGAQYMVSRSGVDGVSGNGYGSVNIFKDQTSTVTLSNERETGGLQITNVLKSDSAADKDREFEYTITLGEAIDGIYNSVMFTNGVASIKLKGGESKLIEGLPRTMSYTVTQSTEAGFTATSETNNASGKIKEALSTVTFTNTRDTGDLSISKEVLNPLTNNDTTKKFEFTITLADTSISKSYAAEGGVYDTVSFSNGVATVKLAHNETVTIKDLPTGVNFTITEDNEIGFRQKGQVGTGTIATTESMVAVENVRDTGSLEVENTVFGTEFDKERDFSFSVTLYRDSSCTVKETSISGAFGDTTFSNGEATFALKHDQRRSATGLPTGIYYVVEAVAVDGFTTVKTGETGVISGTVSRVAFTNTADTRNVTARVVWDDNNDQDGARPTTSVTMKLLADGSLVESVELSSSNNWTFSWTNLYQYDSAGDEIFYRFEEESIPGYTSTKVWNTAMDVNTVTYTHSPSKIIVSGKKYWKDDNNKASARPASIMIRLLADGVEKDSLSINGTDTDADGNWIYYFRNLDQYKNGRLIQYTVTEDAVDYYITDVSGNDFVNTYAPGAANLRIIVRFQTATGSKSIISTDTTGTKITVTGSAGETTYQVGRDFTNGVLTLNDLKVGDYTITEDVNTAHVDGYTLTVTGNRGTVTLEAGKTKEVTIVNTYTGTEVWEAYVYESGEKGYSSAELDLKATASGNLALLVKKAVRNGSGKWVRYGTDGNYVRGWYTVSTPTVEEIYYFDKKTGMKVTGDVVIDGRLCHFDSSSGLYKP